ncbi:hypothetical protein N7493_010713 [Penicillium malachiteum]|uniref:Uncharacterized protein n=1 Tax=Penicillium malachiteum TaxID=1324776 RepID=A0AAD6HDP3_9EURO|nr:hypothetical protein N7493_010713 [Penicillium malachiteum]
MVATAPPAKAAYCTPRSISTARSNLRCFGSVKAPTNGIGQRRTITYLCLNPCERLLEKPNLYRDEMVILLWALAEHSHRLDGLGKQ